MNKQLKDEFTKLFIKQYQLINDINPNIDCICDLHLPFEKEEEVKNLEKKCINLKKIKNQLIKLYSEIISEL